MTVQTDDVNLKIKLVLSDVDRQKKPGEGARVPGQAPGGRRVPGERIPGRDPGGRVPGREPGTPGLPDRRPGQKPGKSRLGRTASRVAGLIGILAAIDLIGPTAVGAGAQLLPGVDEATRRLAREEAVKLWNKSFGAILAGIQAGVHGTAKSVDLLSGLALAGIRLKPEDAETLLKESVQISFREAQIERAKRNLGAVEVGSAGADLVKTGLNDLLDQLWKNAGLEDLVGEKVRELMKNFISPLLPR